MSTSEGIASVFVTVGTDHHPFGRLIGWADSLADDLGAGEVMVQAGTAPAPRLADHVAYMAYGDLTAAMRDSAVVVTHGGPATIMQCRHLGKVPVVVPREHRLGEHVDNHQVVFCERMAELGLIRLARSEEDLRAHITAVLGDPDAGLVDSKENDVTEAVQTFGHLVEDLVARGRPRCALLGTRQRTKRTR